MDRQPVRCRWPTAIPLRQSSRWSEQGKRYRALEREAAATPGTLYFGHLIYADDSAYPHEIETGLLRGDRLHVERFLNRPRDGRPWA